MMQARTESLGKAKPEVVGAVQILGPKAWGMGTEVGAGDSLGTRTGPNLPMAAYFKLLSKRISWVNGQSGDVR